MTDQTVQTQPVAAPDSTLTRSSQPPVEARDPSPVVRGMREVRELGESIAAILLARDLIRSHTAPAWMGLLFAAAIILPSSVLTRYIKILLARGSTGSALSIAAGLATYAHIKTFAVISAGAVVIASCVGGAL